MTTERISDAQARQQLLPTRAAVATTPMHAMMAARAQVLAKPGVDVLRTLAAQATATGLGADSKTKQAGVLYGAVLAETQQRNFVMARQHLGRLQSLNGFDLNALRVIRLLASELALAAGDASQAVTLLEPKATVIASHDRATRMQLARSRIGTQKPAQSKLAASELSLWLTAHPRDASAWLLQASACKPKHAPWSLITVRRSIVSKQHKRWRTNWRVKASWTEEATWRRPSLTHVCVS
jgi:hypothetical protein